MILPSFTHIPVLLQETVAGLQVRKGHVYIDATVGGGGHTEEILRQGGIVLGIDKDKDAVHFLQHKWQENKNVKVRQGNFANIESIAKREGVKEVVGIVFDLGMSTHQLSESGRGFTFERDEPLDMRMDMSQKMGGVDIINTYSEDDLYEIFTKYAEELHSRAISQAIVRTRALNGSIKRTSQLAELIDTIVTKLYRGKERNAFLKIRNGTLARIFQALRIVVNNELYNLEEGLKQGITLLVPGGRLAVISFHSLEDRVVKLFIKREMQKKRLRIITKKPILPTKEEMEYNPKSHCAKLRIAQKL